MRDVKFTDLITKSIDRTAVVLFKPFSVKKWLKLVLIACLAGAISGASSLGGGGKDSNKKAEASPVVAQEQSESVTTANPAETAVAVPTSEDRIRKFFNDQVANFLQLPPGVRAFTIGGGIAGFLFLLALFLWLSSRFKFVWFNAIVHNRDDIREPFRLYQPEGASIFKLSLLVASGFLILIAIVGSWVFVTLSSVGFFKTGVANAGIGNAGGAIVSLVAAFIIFLSVVIGLALWSLCVEHFVIPIMAIDRIGYSSAWLKFWVIYKSNVKDFWLYVLVLIGLKIVGSIAEGIAVFVVAIVGLIIAGIAFGLGYILFAVALKAKSLFWIYAVVLGVPAAILGFVAIVAVGLPCAVFFRNFSLYFLSSLNCGYIPLPLAPIKEGV